MNEIYNQLLAKIRPLKVKLESTETKTLYKKGIPVVTIVHTYKFVGSTGVTKESLNLVERTRKTLELESLRIIRKVSVKQVESNIEFISNEDTVLLAEDDSSLLHLNDVTMLTNINVEIV